MKTTGGAAVAISLAAPGLLLGRQTDQPPNVVFILADQMRGDALSALGHPVARTPYLDRMAAEGVLVANCFTNNPVCVPSRVSFFTGLYPHQHGNLANVSRQFLNGLEHNLLGYFLDRGYRIGWVGKNHTFRREVLDVLDTTHIRAREPFRSYNRFVPPFWHSDMYWPEKQLHGHLNTEEGVTFIRQARKDEPFFLHLSYFDPHPPYMAPSSYASSYQLNKQHLPEYVPPEHLSDRLADQAKALHYDRIEDTDLTETLRYYYASIEWGVDLQVGRILQALEDRGLAENTIVIFSSDHGDFMGEHRMVRKGMFLYDALLHVPMIWYAPGRIRKGLRVENLAQGVDLFPTLIDLTGGKTPHDLPGRSLRPFLEGIKLEEEDYTIYASAAYSDLPEGYFDHPEPPLRQDSDVPFHSRVERLTWQAENRTAMARTDEWKLILNETRPPELYHMAGGWIERENVAGEREHRKVRQSLEQKIGELWRW